MQLKRTEAPLIEPITLEDLKLYLKIYGQEEDTLLSSYIKAGREIVEDLTKRALINQTWCLAFRPLEAIYSPLVKATRAYEPVIHIPRLPLREILHLKVEDKPFGKYKLESNSSVILPAYCFGKNVEITFISGYGESAEQVPEALKMAIRLCAATFYQERSLDLVKGLPRIQPLIKPFQIYSIN